MLRLRLFCPPSQVRLHSDQLSHVSQTQSTALQTGFEHPMTSCRMALHPRPPASGGVRTSRLRWRKPCPQDTEQSVQEVHSESWQSLPSGSSWQGISLQGMVSSVESWQGRPPRLASTSTVRVRTVCPPSQVLSQSFHADQAESLQSTGGSTWDSSQPRVSCRLSVQAAPPLAPGMAMERERYLCLECAGTSGSQADQSLQCDSTQSLAISPSHTMSTLQGRVD
mmetsp:Transcript_21573/g.50565  ORF Transcript_21573/g.50565 Transcript_21573/m.50565 type:complete len:224 (+) Transcript_21573:1447-2118(+)